MPQAETDPQREELLRRLFLVVWALPDGGPFGDTDVDEGQFGFELVANAPEGEAEALKRLLLDKEALAEADRRTAKSRQFSRALEIVFAAHLVIDPDSFVGFVEESVCDPDRRRTTLAALAEIPYFVKGVPSVFLPAIERAWRCSSFPAEVPFNFLSPVWSEVFDMFVFLSRSDPDALPVLERMRDSSPSPSVTHQIEKTMDEVRDLALYRAGGGED